MKIALWIDLKTDEERSAFFLSGRAYETGVVCHSIQNDLAMAYHRLAEMQKELHRLDALNTELVEALEKLARLGNGDSYGNSIGNDIAIAALAKARGGA